MNNLFIIVGASGTGKTSLTKALLAKGVFAAAFEQHETRPFQALFKRDAKYALANQLDYLLLRAEQERELRGADKPGLMDGGLDLDFHGFTRLFLDRGLTSAAEFDLCRRLHALIRQSLPPPDLVIHLRADAQTVRERLARRNRINIASADDAELLEARIAEWLDSLPESQILRLDVSHESEDYPASVPMILDKIAGRTWKT